ncbi:PEP-CTERM sorting domain-containing protein [Cellvibrio sp. PSBB023]|uniref:PEP-CTERM sorting domain-containing protein n=1 Tax=Cellvibrio sp. PSBB023 TaxID=1945512 RepID=UPI00098F0351|nr:PEP-CTERM sorting domain-containing protein [Cellvibrio sp. PSBB023]AQT61523.1 hypothetical protein B0D95_16465 [Cellvibrio sp. PSBB023]
MKLISVVSLLLLLMAPSAMAGLVSLDINKLTTYDWAADEAVVGGNLSFLIDEAVADTDIAPNQGRYYDAIKGGTFKNFQTGETYLFDLDTQNCIDILTFDSLYSDVNLKGYLKNEHGKSVFFEIGMRFVSKADDYLHSLKNNPKVLGSSVLFNLFEEWDHFQGYDPENVSVKPINEVSEPAPLFLLLIGVGTLALRKKRDLSLQ